MNERATAASALFEYVRQAIETGSMSRGFKLPAERSLAEKFQVSRGSVRKAIMKLRDSGYVEQKVGSGTYVVWGKPIGSQAVASVDCLPSPAILSLHTVREISPYELMEARRLIEPLMPRLIVKKANPQNFARMRECLIQSEQADTTEAFEYWDGELHRELAEATHNNFFKEVLRLTNVAREQGEWGRLKKKSLTPERRAAYENQHRALVEALQDRDAEQGTTLLQAHLDEIQANLFGK
ncbi:MAG: FadR/GntR family transcriptional regulator [Comamonas sp.]